MGTGSLIRAIALLVGTSLAASGCGSSSTSSSSRNAGSSPSPAVSIGVGGTAVGTAVAKVEVRDGAFFYKGSGVNPKVGAKVGEVIEWDWLAGDTEPHNVTFASLPALIDNLDPNASSPTQLTAGAAWQVRFTRPGTYGFVCTIHSSSMTGIVEVAQ